MSRRYGWVVLFVAAAAMVGSLPGRTQGLGLVTEPLLAELQIDRVSYATLNLWATLLGSAGALGTGTDESTGAVPGPVMRLCG